MTKRLPDEVVAELVARLHGARASLPLLLIAVGLPATYAYVLVGDANVDRWAAAAVATVLLRIVAMQFYVRFGSRHHSARAQRVWQVTYFVPGLAAGIAQAGLAIALLLADQFWIFAWMMTTLVGTTYGSVACVALRPWIGIPLVTLPLLTCAVALATMQEEMFLLMAGSLVVACISLVEHCTRQYRETLALIQAHREMERLSRTDDLTGLWNRRYFEEALQAVTVEKNVCASLLVIDLDRFKPINDRYGHGVGDLVLKEVAKRIKAVAGAGAFVARNGGDEFAVLALVEPAKAEHLGFRISDAIGAPMRIAETVIRVGASVGVATVHGGDDPSAAVCQADERMYARKSKRSIAIPQVVPA